MHILVTGFEPFGQDSINASAQVLERLPSRLAGHRISTAILPVSFSRTGPALEAALVQHRPDALICLGEAGGRTRITPELWAYNLDKARIADNDGQRPDSTPIATDGPERVRATLDPEPMLQALHEIGLPAALSRDPGRFLCNHTAYRAYRSAVPALFIHLPAVRDAGQMALVGAETDQAAPVATSLDFTRLSQGIEVCLGTL
ncbi:pyroglutamyl-peptidase I [Glutamicibacter sp. MNS18]|uniref:pyroglutamyl-peptidase I family protein n=1 Tax=Glutamicibacter sp. MNS18 TaxID=2989817 RepID=UPI00223600D2|nr:pyroglutamyl-peptidase I [Glutamicibacter sp. MNS18]MCW4466714.1 pyroglutamyl-peptidase I [Glutamicibacter sp. MNS18]